MWCYNTMLEQRVVAYKDKPVIQRFWISCSRRCAPAARANQPQIALLSQLATPRAPNTSHMVEKP